jgi:tRNA (guanine-N7-)-methyltransferase
VRENPARTEAYFGVVKERREALQALFAALLKPDEPFVWEVGSGHGHYLTGYAAAHPRELCLGIDIAKDRVARGKRKQGRAKLPLLHFIHADSGDFLAALPDHARFSRIFVLFPDPWPKRRHEKNRLIQSDFLKETARRAGKGVRFYFRTDHSEYFRSAAAVFASQQDWKVLPEAAWPFELPTVFQEKADAYQSLVAERV